VSADLKVRWCSSYLKIDVCAIAIRNQARFDVSHARRLGRAGRRVAGAREVLRRSRPTAPTLDGRDRRHVDRWRPVHAVE
jgi:DNA sulfur modification protein DndC